MKFTLKKRTKRQFTNPNTRVCEAIDVARWFAQENEQDLPPGMFSKLSGALRARDSAALRKISDSYGVPQLYGHPQDYSVVAQAVALFSKCPLPFGGGDTERKAAAWRKFQDTETSCRISSRRLDYYGARPCREDHLMRLIFSRARDLVDKVMGDPDKMLQSMIEGCRFGPGMTSTSVDSARTTPYYKFEEECWSVTPSARPYADLGVLQSPFWVLERGEISLMDKTVRLPWKNVQSCRLTFVPKDERTFRTIAIEPYGNVFLQLGLHGYLEERLYRIARIDIRDQSRNQSLAKFGSENWLKMDTVSTIDLSSASDCVSSGLIRRLVRPQVAAILDDLRSKFYEHEGVEYAFAKWSSMGNGYTFALETLLFWALAQSCEDYCNGDDKKWASVYGDDIIVTRRSSLLVLQVLRYAGFKINNSKTNIVGPFRESCGEDFHSGVAVRPTFVKEFHLRSSDVFRLMNTLCVDVRFRSSVLFSTLLERIPKDLRLFGTPSDNVDACIHAPMWWLMSTVNPSKLRYNKLNNTLSYRGLLFKPRQYDGVDSLKYLTWLYNNRGARYNYRTCHSEKILAERFNALLGSPTKVTVTQRKRGVLRIRSIPCDIRRTVDRDFCHLA